MINAILLDKESLYKTSIDYGLKGVLTDPFPIGVLVMCLVSVIYNLSELDDTYPFMAMNFFIVTKFISQVTHAGHNNQDASGRSVHHESESKSGLSDVVRQVVKLKKLSKQSGGNVFRGFNILN